MSGFDAMIISITHLLNKQADDEHFCSGSNKKFLVSSDQRLLPLTYFESTASMSISSLGLIAASFIDRNWQ